MKIKLNPFTIFLLKGIRKITHSKRKRNSSLSDYSWIYEGYCDKKDQEANDAILKCLNSYTGGGFMISKWGTTELSQVAATLLHLNGMSLNDIEKYLNHEISSIDDNQTYINLFLLSGVFPKNREIGREFAMQAIEDSKLIDILGSYIKEESIIDNIMKPKLRVNLDAFYAPWLFNNPWTKWLKGKKVLVVHPFVESISYQYHNNRERLFDNPVVLPEFKSLVCIKAVQTLAGQKSKFHNWFEALDYMKGQIDECDYDVAIIGCGAYGMSLAAHVKRQGKVAIHLAGWTQMLFGVYGERWVSQQSKYSSVINQYWIRPNKNENVKNGSKIEGGCYW